MTPRQKELAKRDKEIVKLFQKMKRGKKRPNKAYIGRLFGITRERVRQIIAIHS